MRETLRDKFKWFFCYFFPDLKCNCKLKFKFKSTHFNLALGHFCINVEFTIYVIQKNINENLRIRPANHKAMGSMLTSNSGQTSREVSGISLSKQECIPVGCVPSAALAVCRAGVCLSACWDTPPTWTWTPPVSASGPRGCIPACNGADTSPWTDRHLWKHNLRKLRLRAVINVLLSHYNVKPLAFSGYRFWKYLHIFHGWFHKAQITFHWTPIICGQFCISFEIIQLKSDLQKETPLFFTVHFCQY